MKYFLKTLKIVGIILAIPIVLYTLYMLLHLILAFRSQSFPKIPTEYGNSVIVDQENDICVYIYYSVGSEVYSGVNSFLCERLKEIQYEEELKGGDPNDVTIKSYAYTDSGNKPLYLDLVGGSTCSVVDLVTIKNQKYIKIEEDKFCTDFLNGFFMDKKEDEFYRVNEQGIFIQGTFDESENFVDLILEETEKE